MNHITERQTTPQRKLSVPGSPPRTAKSRHINPVYQLAGRSNSTLT